MMVPVTTNQSFYQRFRWSERRGGDRDRTGVQGFAGPRLTPQTPRSDPTSTASQEAACHLPTGQEYRASKPCTRKLAFVALPVAALVLAAACVPPGCIPLGWSWVGPQPPAARVAVVGDSLTWQAEHGSSSTSDQWYARHRLIDAINAEGMAARVAARSGETTAVLRLWGGWVSPPDVIVMALGTNDQYYNVPFATSQANVRTYLARWPAARVVYVGVVLSVPRGIADTAPAWNDWLRAEAAATGGVYLDWPALSAGHPEWFIADQLHHTPAGQQAYRQAIVDAVNEATA